MTTAATPIPGDGALASVPGTVIKVRRPPPDERSPMPKAPSERGKGARSGGRFEDRVHYVPVGRRLRLYRERAGLSQRDLEALTDQVVAEEGARAAREQRPARWKRGLSAYAVNRFENGVHSPLPRNADLLAVALSRALSEKAGHPIVLTRSDLQAGTTEDLVTYLENIRWRKDRPEDFYPQIGIRQDVADLLVAGKTPWTAEALGAVAVAFPEASDLVVGALAEQARQRRGLPGYREYAVRDVRHPQYRPSQPARRPKAKPE
jgi:transcriptional regulator with XRE-family HTH domain